MTVVGWECRRRQLSKGMESTFVDVDKLAGLEDEYRWVVIHSSALLDSVCSRPIRFGTEAVAVGQTVQSVVLGPFLLLGLIVEDVQSSLLVLLGHPSEHDDFVVTRKTLVATIHRTMTILMEVGERSCKMN